MPELHHKYMKNIKILFVTLGLILVFSSFGLAQSLSFPSLEGNNVSIQSDKGKVVVLAVGATWLPLSKNQAIVLNKLAKSYAGRDVIVYFVTTDSTAAKSKNYASDEDVKAFAAKNKITSSILRDSDGGLIMKSFKLDQIPAFIIINKEGKPAGDPIGGLTPDQENDLITQISNIINGLL